MIINVKVTPRSKKVSIDETIDIFGNKSLHVRLISAPEDNKANLELISILAEYYKTNKKSITINSGHISRNKIVEICLQKE